MNDSVLLLGKGYTGSFLIDLLRAKNRHVTVATRHPSGPDEIHFDLEDVTTWDRLPPSHAVVWLFPPTPLESVKNLSHKILDGHRRLVVLGTTSSFVPPHTDAPVDESTPLNPLTSRVLGEEFLRSRGAIVLRSAGIYGPPAHGHRGRDPVDWLKRGLIADGFKYLNLIHVTDLACAIDAAWEKGSPGEQYIVSDGMPMRWSEIAEICRNAGLIDDPNFSGGSGGDSKRLSNGKMQRELGIDISVTLRDFLTLRAQQSPRHR